MTHSPTKDPTTWHYPAIEARHQFMMDVGDGHTIYVEESGNPKGKPVVFVHGGPGGGTSPTHRRFFDPRGYRIILFDQRGSGKSKPHASLENNTTWHLVADMEKIREKLQIDRWQVFGGSWGATLALAYAVTHPTRVTELVLRGIFMLRKKELQWFYQEGAHNIFPDAWEPYLNFIPPNERGDLIAAYHKRLTSTDEETRLEAARIWSVWEGVTSHLLPDDQNALAASHEDAQFALAFARIENHYFVNKGFFTHENFLLDEAEKKLAQIPTTIVQGRYDIVCPMITAWELKAKMPHADFVLIPDAGHSAFEPGVSRALVAATDRYLYF